MVGMVRRWLMRLLSLLFWYRPVSAVSASQLVPVPR